MKPKQQLTIPFENDAIERVLKRVSESIEEDKDDGSVVRTPMIHINKKPEA